MIYNVFNIFAIFFLFGMYICRFWYYFNYCNYFIYDDNMIYFLPIFNMIAWHNNNNIKNIFFVNIYICYFDYFYFFLHCAGISSYLKYNFLFELFFNIYINDQHKKHTKYNIFSIIWNCFYNFFKHNHVMASFDIFC